MNCGKTVVKSKWRIGSCFLNHPSFTNLNCDLVHLFRINVRNFFRCASVHIENCQKQKKLAEGEFHHGLF